MRARARQATNNQTKPSQHTNQHTETAIRLRAISPSLRHTCRHIRTYRFSIRESSSSSSTHENHQHIDALVATNMSRRRSTGTRRRLRRPHRNPCAKCECGIYSWESCVRSLQICMLLGLGRLVVLCVEVHKGGSIKLYLSVFNSSFVMRRYRTEIRNNDLRILFIKIWC